MTSYVKKAILFLLPVCGIGFAQQIWYGDPDLPWREVFDNFNREPAGTLDVATDPEYGKVWHVNKPGGSKRAEIRGAKGYAQKEGETYYISWNWKINFEAEKVDGFAIFQWKSYGDGVRQNYPFNMGYDGKKVSLTAFDDDWQSDRKRRIHHLWEKPAKKDEWVNFVIVVKLSRDHEEGYIELYFNGDKQTFSNGETRFYHKTMDGEETAPKWGAYNENSRPHDITVELSAMQIAIDLKSVGIGSPSGEKEVFRTFSGQDGQTVEARVLAYNETSGEVTLFRRDHQRFVVPIDTFCDADQTYIKETFGRQHNRAEQ